MKQPTTKFKKMCKVYKIFSNDWKHICDYSKESMLELYNAETYGSCDCKPNNGFYVGKKWLNVTVTMWKEDIEKGLLFKFELYDDPKFPDWWLNKVLN